MKVFISADIEGVATTTLWAQTETVNKPGLAAEHCRQMTNEVKAACEGAIAAGATYILVKDAHSNAVNINIAELPECVEVIRNWSGHPYGMSEGIDSSFDAAMFIGYHSAAGRCGNPLSHTFSGQTVWVKLNGVKCSEFMLYSYACALEGVPTLLLSGDKMLCDDSADLHPSLSTVPTKDGLGGRTQSIHPNLVCKNIKEAAEKALGQDLKEALCELPEHFVFELCYKEHKNAVKHSHFPGFKLVDDNTIRMETDSMYEVLRAGRYVM